MNIKRIHRIWRQEGLQVPQRTQQKRLRLGSSENGSQRLKAAYPGHVWSLDFLFDSTDDGRTLKLMPVVDEFTRQSHAIHVDRSITMTLPRIIDPVIMLGDARNQQHHDEENQTHA